MANYLVIRSMCTPPSPPGWDASKLHGYPNINTPSSPPPPPLGWDASKLQGYPNIKFPSRYPTILVPNRRHRMRGVPRPTWTRNTVPSQAWLIPKSLDPEPRPLTIKLPTYTMYLWVILICLLSQKCSKIPVISSTINFIFFKLLNSANLLFTIYK